MRTLEEIIASVGRLMISWRCSLLLWRWARFLARHLFDEGAVRVFGRLEVCKAHRDAVAATSTHRHHLRLLLPILTLRRLKFRFSLEEEAEKKDQTLISRL